MNFLTKGKNMRTAEQIRAILKDYIIRNVANDIGVHSNSLYAFMRGESDPKISTIEKLDAYIDAKIEAAAKQ